jgi:meso-butanediol dehydrogenase / (S,S)-butanediol dehydrogenase / diacetyl reductase
MVIPQRLPGKVALVSGAGHGIGRASAHRLGQEGARIAAVDIRADAAAQTQAILAADGIEAIAVIADVSVLEDAQAAVEAVVERFGRVDILHNNAGVLIPGTVLTQTLADWDRTFGVNVRGMMLMTRHVIPVMQEQGGGVIINTASISGMVGEPNLVAYDTSKGAVINFTRQLAVEYARDNIRCNCICPGWIDTGFNDPIFEQANMSQDDIAAMVAQFVPMNRQGTAADIAPSVAFLACDDAAYITGHALVIDGGLMAQ